MIGIIWKLLNNIYIPWLEKSENYSITHIPFLTGIIWKLLNKIHIPWLEINQYYIQFLIGTIWKLLNNIRKFINNRIFYFYTITQYIVFCYYIQFCNSENQFTIGEVLLYFISLTFLRYSQEVVPVNMLVVVLFVWLAVPLVI